MVSRIFNLMEERGIKATNLANAIGLNSAVFTQWKKGLQKPSTDAVIKIAQYFNVTTDYLLLGAEAGLTKDEMELLEYYRSFNTEGKNKTLVYMQDLDEGFRYKKRDSAPSTNDIERISG